MSQNDSPPGQHPQESPATALCEFPPFEKLKGRKPYGVAAVLGQGAVVISDGDWGAHGFVLILPVKEPMEIGSKVSEEAAQQNLLDGPGAMLIFTNLASVANFRKNLDAIEVHLKRTELRIFAFTLDGTTTYISAKSTPHAMNLAAHAYEQGEKRGLFAFRILESQGITELTPREAGEIKLGDTNLWSAYYAMDGKPGKIATVSAGKIDIHAPIADSQGEG